MEINYIKEGKFQGHAYGIISNVKSTPNILVVGPIAARDFFLFPSSPENVKMYTRIWGEEPRFEQINKENYIINNAWGGGAAHHIIEQIPLYSPLECDIGLFSVVGSNPKLPEMINNLVKNRIQYYIVHFYNMPYTRFAGVLFPSGERYLSRKLHYYGSMELFHPDLLPEAFKKAEIMIVTTLPPKIVKSFSIKCTGTLVGQLFQHYFTRDNHEYLKILLNNIWSKKCSLININEIEMMLLEKLNAENSNDIKSLPFIMKSLMDKMSKSFSNMTYLIGIGEHGMYAYHNNSSERITYYHPAIKSKWEFCLGAGDTALASSIGTILKLALEKGYEYRNIKYSLNMFDYSDWEKVCKSFVEGGFIGISILDAFTDISIRKELASIAQERVIKNSMIEDKEGINMDMVKIPKINEILAQLQQGYFNNEIEEVLYRAFGDIKIRI